MKDNKNDQYIIKNQERIEKQVFIQTNNGIVNINNANSYSELSTFSPVKINQQFQQASHELSNYQNYFEGLPNSHLQRKETEELLNWTKTPLTKNDSPIAMLVGNAGYGKSVILKDLFQKLRNEGVSVLGIKADKYYVAGISELENRLGVDDRIEAMARKLQKKEKKVVILIDQIDALSLSLSTDRKYLTAYKQLVTKLSAIPDIRIIISVRLYDLNYDQGLNFSEQDSEKGEKEKSQKTVKVNLLDIQQVEDVLSQLHVNQNNLSTKLIELLRTPLHLNVFCKVYNAAIHLQNIKTLQDLYFELWRQKVLEIPHNSNVQKDNVITLLYTIVNGIEISISELPLRDKFHRELQYLKSIGIIKESGGTIQFFHQTFFDFVFAKKFVESKDDVWTFLKRHKQGLLVRAKLKMIINYLRDYDVDRYLKLSKKLLTNNEASFHIKHLIMTLMAYRNNPSIKELDFVAKIILTHPTQKLDFLKSTTGQGWLKWMVDKDILDTLLFSKNEKDEIKLNQSEEQRNLWLTILFRKIGDEQPLVLKYISELPNFETKSKRVYNKTGAAYF